MGENKTGNRVPVTRKCLCGNLCQSSQNQITLQIPDRSVIKKRIFLYFSWLDQVIKLLLFSLHHITPIHLHTVHTINKSSLNSWGPDLHHEGFTMLSRYRRYSLQKTKHNLKTVNVCQHENRYKSLINKVVTG